MSLSLLGYIIATWLFEPFSNIVLKKRLKAGKERESRLPERRGISSIPRPNGKLIWMHGASVGETSMLLSLYKKIQLDFPDVTLLITSQTLTSADMITAKSNDAIIHQMAPIDGPRAVAKFLNHWQPDLGVIAEGEIWPNLIRTANRNEISLFFVNARMTQKTIESWKKRRSASHEIFSNFQFIGAADRQTAAGLDIISSKSVDAIGNLKRAIEAPTCNKQELSNWQNKLKNRPVLLAASTHASEEKLAIDAFVEIQKTIPDAHLIIVPRHPKRADDIKLILENKNLNFNQRSKSGNMQDNASVLLADTIGEMGLWMHLADGIYLGGANKEGVGGHNPIEPLKLRKPVFMGPHSFNFKDLIEALEQSKTIVIGESGRELAQFWIEQIEKQDKNSDVISKYDWNLVNSVFSAVDEPLALTLNAITTQLED